MIAYSDYQYDARVRREAETLYRSEKFKVSILTLKAGSRPRHFNLNGVQVIEVNQRKYEGQKKSRYIISYFHFLIRCFAICTWMFLKRQIDIIHIHNMPDFLIFAGIVPRLLGRKLILDIHDSVPETYLSKFSEKNSLMFKLMCLEEITSTIFAHRIICVNHVQKNAVVARGVSPTRITVSMNVPDPVLFPVNGIVKAPLKCGKAFRMIYHGTIANRLGVDLIVKVVAELAKKIPHLQFHLWAKAGAPLESIVKLAISLNVYDRLRILPGGIALENLADSLKVMDLGVIGNRKGSATNLMLPVKMLEYIAVGVPVVAPRLQCIQYYFSDEMVSFYEPENVSSMSYAILRLHEDEKKRIHQSQAARRFFDKYGWKSHKHDLLNMYKNL
jgi:glycosyltransferase involved in cell wall biosynthesis